MQHRLAGGVCTAALIVCVACNGVVDPSKNVTDPPGTPAPGALAATVAVIVTAWPRTEVDEVSETVVVVLAALTLSAAAVDTLEEKLALPP